MEVGEGVASLSPQLPHLSSSLLGTQAAMIPAGRDYKPLEFHLYGRECPECDKRRLSCLTCRPDPRVRPRADGCHATSPGLLESTCKERACPLSPSPSASWQKLGPRRKENPTRSVQRYTLCDYLAVCFVIFCFLKVSRKDRFQHSCRRWPPWGQVPGSSLENPLLWMQLSTISRTRNCNKHPSFCSLTHSNARRTDITLLKWAQWLLSK